jgi:hypothetical protein
MILYEDDTSSEALYDVSGALVINVSGKAVVAWARITTMRTDPPSEPAFLTLLL